MTLCGQRTCQINAAPSPAQLCRRYRRTCQGAASRRCYVSFLLLVRQYRPKSV